VFIKPITNHQSPITVQSCGDSGVFLSLRGSALDPTGAGYVAGKAITAKKIQTNGFESRLNVSNNTTRETINQWHSPRGDCGSSIT
jgi:hypothetical protein